MSKFASELDQWQSRWETDPNVMFKDIAAQVGCSAVLVSGYACKQGWTPSPGVAEERRSLRAIRPHVRVRKVASTGPNYAQPPLNTAWTSAFDIGTPVSTRSIVPESPHIKVDEDEEDEA